MHERRPALSHSLENPYRNQGLPGGGAPGGPRRPDSDAGGVAALLARCPVHAPTPLIALPAFARSLGIGRLTLKDERARMGLGSFKALGAAHAIAVAAVEAGGDGPLDTALAGRSYIAASAGNHGLSVAAGARIFGARAVIYLAETVPEAFAARLAAKGAEVVRAGASYEDSMEAAAEAAAAGGGTLLSDSSWPSYEDLPAQVMEGYLQLAAESVAALDTAPTHVFLQAGVGGLAAAVAAHLRAAWRDGPVITVVEPEAAPALLRSIEAGRLVTATGPVSAMGRLDCKTPSMIALAGLAHDADWFVTISEEAARGAVDRLARHGVATTPSGAAGVAALTAGIGPALGPDTHALAIVSEGPEEV